MKWFTSFAVFCTALFSSVQAEEFPVAEVMEMAEKNLEVRKNWVLTRDIKEIRALEIETTLRLKEILARHGLPAGYDLDELVDVILQLVLSSSDLNFQKQILEMTASAGDLWSENIDLLTDRVLIRQGLPQRYGTHLYHEAGELIPYPIEDVEKMNELREEIKEPSFTEYLKIAQQFERAIAQNDDIELYKSVFNMINDFFETPSDYLYYASFEPNCQPEEDGRYLAFEDPALAAAYTLCKTTPVIGDAFYQEATKEVGKHLLVLMSPQSTDDAAIVTDTPIYMYLIPRGNFQPHESYREAYLDRLLSSPLKSAPVAEIQCNSIMEVLILGGSQIKIYGSGQEYTYKDATIKALIQKMLFFDITLENEHFNQM